MHVVLNFWIADGEPNCDVFGPLPKAVAEFRAKALRQKYPNHDIMVREVLLPDPEVFQ